MTAGLFLLPYELRYEIYSYILTRNLSHLSSLRRVNQRFYQEISPLYYRHYVAKIECWGFDGLEEEHPGHLYSSRAFSRLRTAIKINILRLFGFRVPRTLFLDKMNDQEMSDYRVDSTGPRNYKWVCEMPALARRHIRQIQLFGPTPEGSYNMVGPPPRWMRRGAADWCAPMRKIVEWLRQNMEALESMDYCMIAGISHCIPQSDIVETLRVLSQPENKPPCRKIALVIGHPTFGRTILGRRGSYMKEWVSSIEMAINAGSCFEHVEIWVTRNFMDILLERPPGGYRLHCIIFLHNLRNLRKIEGLKSVRIYRYNNDDFSYLSEGVYPLLSRQKSPLEEVFIELDEVDASHNHSGH